MASSVLKILSARIAVRIWKDGYPLLTSLRAAPPFPERPVAGAKKDAILRHALQAASAGVIKDINVCRI
jgi:hypothetical protein